MQKFWIGFWKATAVANWKNVGGDTGRAAVVPPVHALVEEGAAELHTSHGVANKGMKRGIECFVVAEMLVENHILGCQHGLAAHIIGIHALPAARNVHPWNITCSP